MWRRQGELNEDAVDRGIGVEPVDRGQEPVLVGVGGQSHDRAVHPGGLAGILLVADIDLAGGIVADQDDRQAGDRRPTRRSAAPPRRRRRS